MNRLAAAVMAALLTGCATQAEKQRAQMQGALSPFVGRTIAEYALLKGNPSNVLDLAPNKRGFQWVFNSQGPGAVVPVAGMMIAVPPQQQQCRVTFTASTSKPAPSLSDWLIEGYSWDGAC